MSHKIHALGIVLVAALALLILFGGENPRDRATAAPTSTPPPPTAVFTPRYALAIFKTTGALLRLNCQTGGLQLFSRGATRDLGAPPDAPVGDYAMTLDEYFGAVVVMNTATGEMWRAPVDEQATGAGLWQKIAARE